MLSTDEKDWVFLENGPWGCDAGFESDSKRQCECHKLGRSIRMLLDGYRAGYRADMISRMAYVIPLFPVFPKDELMRGKETGKSTPYPKNGLTGPI